jgi:hypothetical protein
MNYCLPEYEEKELLQMMVKNTSRYSRGESSKQRLYRGLNKEIV